MDRICGIPIWCKNQKCFEKLKLHRDWEHCHVRGCHRLNIKDKLPYENGIYCIVCTEWFCEFHEFSELGIFDCHDFNCVDCIMPPYNKFI